jgi:uncharacterized protein (DUF488 family)
MILFTIGFTEKPAERFFELIRANRVEKVVDIRLRPDGQLAGFAKKVDLPFFLRELAACDYAHLPQLAPSDEILDGYRQSKSKDWDGYVERFERLMDERGVPETLDRAMFESARCCLLCSEHVPERCHRRLVAERIARTWPDVEVLHLM